jgi:hypothetical protein
VRGQFEDMRGRNLTKVLGLSLLAIVAVMAVNASAAQANWLLLKDLVSVNTLNLTGQILEGELLVKDLNLKIYCAKGTATATVTDGTPISGTAHTLFELCSVLLFSNCQVHSTGVASGNILAQGSGSGIWMSSNDSVLVLATSAAFTTIEFLGVTCPFIDTIEPVSGGVLLELLEASSPHLLKRLAHLDDHELFFGGEEALLDGPISSHGNPTLPLPADTGLIHVEEEKGSLWAIELTGL